MLKVDAVLNTCGDGYWSSKRAAVKLNKLALGYVNDEEDFGELRVYFNVNTWRVNRDGLIYTDSQFLKELRKLLNSLGYKGNDVDYSEQGMQGDNYVSLDVGKRFLDSWKAEV